MPNSLVAEAIELGCLNQFAGYSGVNREVTFGESRLDLMLEGPNGRCYVETKSVTLVVDGVGLFPDAPTERGAKHMRSLDQAVAQGHRAAVVFVVQRPDVAAFAPHDTADPNFGSAVRHSLSCGVEVFASIAAFRNSRSRCTLPCLCACETAPRERPAPVLMQVYNLLYRRYGPQGWWPGDGPLDVVIGAILTQAAAWTNVEMAIANMKDAGCWSLQEIDRLPERELAAIIRPRVISTPRRASSRPSPATWKPTIRAAWKGFCPNRSKD